MRAESLESRLDIIAMYLLYRKLMRSKVPFAHYHYLWYCTTGIN